MDIMKPQPEPVVVFDAPCVQDRVIEDLRSNLNGSLLTTEVGTFSDVAAELVVADLETRKEHGLAKYGTLLQPFNGRDALVDAYQEAIDLAQYLKQDNLEGRDEMQQAYRHALQLTLHLRTVLEDRARA